MTSRDRIIVAEHILEVRHQATGRFLDVRGSVADHIRNADLFHHWSIETNIVKFRDVDGGIKTDGAFAGYRSAGYFVYDPGTRNYFEDKAIKYWKTLCKTQHYTVPPPTRFGCRTKAFLNVDSSFEEVNEAIYNTFFTEKFRSTVGEKEVDLQAVLELSGPDFDTRLVAGPIHKDEAGKYFSFESDRFSEAGLFLDIDVYRNADINPDGIPRLIKSAMGAIWRRIDTITEALEI